MWLEAGRPECMGKEGRVFVCLYLYVCLYVCVRVSVYVSVSKITFPD